MSTTSYPYDTVVYITDMIAGVQYQASGVLIAPDEVLTASHVLYSLIGGPAYDITVTPAYDGSGDPFGSASGTAIHYNQILDTNDAIPLIEIENDYAVIHLSQPFTNLGTMGIDPNYLGQQVNVTGYPAVAGGAQITQPEFVSLNFPYGSVYIGFSIGAGSSGGPVWIDTASGPEVVGIVSSADGAGNGYFPQITSADLSVIQAWEREDEAAGSTTPPAPLSISGAVSGQPTDDTSSIQPFQTVTITDPNAGQTDSVTVALSDAANGTFDNWGGGSFDAATGIWSYTGTAAAVTAALQGLEFVPTVNQVAPGQAVTTTFTIFATDTAGATGSDSTTSVVATDLAVPVTITGTFAGWSAIDQAPTMPFARAVIADPNAGQTETLTVTLSDTANGAFVDLGGGSYDAATGIYTDTGSAAAVTAALQGLAFAPTLNQVAPGLSVTTSFTIQVSDTAGQSATDSTTSVIATDVAVPPAITGAIAGQTVTDAATIAPFTGVSVTDANPGQTEAVTLVMYDPEDGTLENLGGGSYDPAAGVYTDSGSAAAVTAALDGLVFKPAFGEAPVGQTVTTAFAISVTDSAGASGNSGETSVITTEVPCYLRGTRIATPAGERAVEALAEGDLVLTQSGAARPVTWIGHRRVDCRRHRRPHAVFPVRVCAGAFGDGLPARDLRLSPDHAVFMYGALIPIRRLINGVTVIQEPAAEASYFHVELPSHDVILAEGLPAESYLELGNRGAFENGGGAIALHPDFAARAWRRQACAELVLGGPVLAAVRRRLLLQAKLLGHATTADPDLRVIANGRALRAEAVAGRSRVALPDRVRSLRIRSRTWVPAHVGTADDDRRLGVAIARLWLDRRQVSLESAGLSRGWHAAERDWRWTDGDAALEVGGAGELAFEVARTGTYWVERPRPASRPASRPAALSG